MKNKFWLRGFGHFLLLILGFLLIAFIVVHLWNFLIPKIFEGPEINFHEAIGLMILGRLITGGFHRMAGGHRYRYLRWKENYDAMTPEEKEKFREKWERRCY